MLVCQTHYYCEESRMCLCYNNTHKKMREIAVEPLLSSLERERATDRETDRKGEERERGRGEREEREPASERARERERAREHRSSEHASSVARMSLTSYDSCL